MKVPVPSSSEMFEVFLSQSQQSQVPVAPWRCLHSAESKTRRLGFQAEPSATCAGGGAVAFGA